jgi:hypothetical protein
MSGHWCAQSCSEESLPMKDSSSKANSPVITSRRRPQITHSKMGKDMTLEECGALFEITVAEAEKNLRSAEKPTELNELYTKHEGIIYNAIFYDCELIFAQGTSTMMRHCSRGILKSIKPSSKNGAHLKSST